MPIMVNSPYSGRAVKVRDQDIGRAVRDEDGRIFYVLQRSDGKGFYSSPTRAGGPKDEARYLEMEQKMATALDTGAKLTDAQLKHVHDATGKARGKGRRLAYIVLLILILLGLAYAFRDKLGFTQEPQHVPTELLPGPNGMMDFRSPMPLSHPFDFRLTLHLLA